jgi:hypothetical protein
MMISFRVHDNKCGEDLRENREIKKWLPAQLGLGKFDLEIKAYGLDPDRDLVKKDLCK